MVIRFATSIDLPMQFLVPFRMEQLEFECLNHFYHLFMIILYTIK